MAISFARSYVSSYDLLVEVETAELARKLDAKAGKGLHTSSNSPESL